MSTPPEDRFGSSPSRRVYRSSGVGAGGDDWAGVEPAYDDDLGLTHRRSGGRRRRRGRLLGFLLVAVVAFVVGIGAGYVRGYFAPGEVGGSVSVTIPEGASLSEIGAALEQQGVVKHARAFVIQAESDGYATKFKPGTYTFRQNEPYAALVAALLRGVKPPTVKVTIPEGSTLEQSAAIAGAKVKRISPGGYIGVARDDPPPFEFEGYEQGSTLEGLLFPATYEVLPSMSASEFVDTQLSTFDERFAEVDMSRAAKANLTPYDVVIIASLIEREAQVAAERRLVAAVIWNRLRKGMRLQIDATVQYALGEQKPVLTYDDLKIESPYNTYLHDGLPPTPIANPGLAAMQAAADPAGVDYLYYVARADGTGRHFFSSTFEQFQVDKAKAHANAQ